MNYLSAFKPNYGFAEILRVLFCHYKYTTKLSRKFQGYLQIIAGHSEWFARVTSDIAMLVLFLRVTFIVNMFVSTANDRLFLFVNPSSLENRWYSIHLADKLPFQELSLQTLIKHLYTV